MRLTKNGTIDKRGGKIGNKGNKHAKGRRKIDGQETRTNMMLYTSDNEFSVIQDFCHILKSDREKALQIIDSMGTPPPKTKKPPKRERKRHGIRLLADEKIIVKKMLMLTRDRLTACRLAIDAAKND